jgi:DNA-binding LacI/PurR family transcriptional regulator
MTSNRTFVSAKEVAKLAGVSRSAVSRTFTPGASVAEETRRRVLQAAETLGYHVNHLARGLLNRRSGIVCLIVAAVDTPFQSRLVRLLTGRLQEAGKVTMVINSSGSAADVAAAVRQTLNYRADATIVLSGSPDPSLARTCVDNGQELILINRDQDFPEAHTVVVANAKAAEQAVMTFLRAGCSRLACITSDAGTPSLTERERAFLAAARASGSEPILWRAGRTSYETGAAAARALLTQRSVPDAAFCINDLIACGFIDVARHEFGLRIPEDLCVIGFDDIEQAAWSSYDLTTFAQPLDEVTRHVVGLLEMGAQPGRRGTREVFDVPLIWRRSVRQRSRGGGRQPRKSRTMTDA